MKSISKDKLSEAIKNSWSIESSTKWTKKNPASGQCGVTALIVHDYLGGKILKTSHGNMWHFYNLIEGESIDFTKSQFDQPIKYENLISNREEAFNDTNAQQYNYLSSEVRKQLKILNEPSKADFKSLVGPG